MSEELTETDLWLRAVAGEPDARARIAELAERYGRATLQRHGVRLPDLDDLVQEVVIGVDRCRASGQGVRVFQKFVYFRSLSILKTHRSRLRLRKHDAIDAVEPISDRPGPGGEMENLELTQAVASCRDALPEPLRVVVSLRHTQDCTLPEIADRLQLSLGGVRERLRRAWQQVQACLRGRGFHFDEDRS